MGKKSLGRGLEDISDIFLSTRKDKKMLGGFSSEKLRDTTCESCTSIINDSDKGLKCKIFTFENKKYGVRYMDTVSRTSANYCEFFKAASQENTDNRFVVKGKFSDNTEINCEIEDHVIVRRNIAYPNTPDVQQNILDSLSKHLEENYHIKSIALAKIDEVSQPGRKKFVEEEITIFIKDHLSNSSLSHLKK